MSSSYKQPDMLLKLDDEEGDRNELSSIDKAHHFLNFSRKVTEASSMRKPVDIQLGISCGKDLIFGFPSRMVRRPQQQHTSPLSKKDVPVQHDVIDKERKPTQKKYTSMNPTTTTTTHSSLLDQLVADVLNHIDSCPEKSAYSDDLDRLKPKLQAYSVTHLPQFVN